MNEQLCRTCLTKMDLSESIFQIVAVIDEEDVTLVEMLDACTGIKANENDKISLCICNICINDIIKSFTFRKMCWNSQQFLLKTLENDRTSIAIPIAERFVTDLKVDILDADEIDQLVGDSQSTNEDVLESIDPIVEDNVLNEEKMTNEDNETDEEEINKDLNNLNEDSNFKNTLSDKYVVYLDDGPLYKSAVKCKLCGKVYRSRFSIDNHLFIKHNIQVKQMFPCTQCTKSFRRMESLHEHIPRVHPITEPKGEITNSSNISAQDYYEYLDNNKQLPTSAVICKLCQRKLTRRSLMYRHLYESHGINVPRGFKCTLCNELFCNLSRLKRHIQRIHPNNQSDNINVNSNFKLAHCNETYYKKDDLKRNIEHQRKKDQNCSHKLPHICEHCGLVLKNRRSYTQHMLRHTGEKPFKCELCDYRAITADYIRVHMRMHTGQRPFKCDLCDKFYSTTSGRALHRRVHFDERPYKCVVCLKTFKKREIYRGHMLIHNSDKHVECQYCGKRFARKENLKTHIKQHTDEKPHTCEYCGKGFIQKHCWRTHLKNHHNKLIE